MIRNERGFTLLEVMIAILILVLSFTAILDMQTSSLRATSRAKEMTTIGMLAKQALIDAEYNLEGRTFEEIPEIEEGTFDEPFEDFKWERIVKEVEFPNLMEAAASAGGGDGEEPELGQPGQNNQFTDQLGKGISDFFSKGLREVIVSVIWMRDGKEVSFSVTTYWVNLDYEIDLGI